MSFPETEFDASAQEVHEISCTESAVSRSQRIKDLLAAGPPERAPPLPPCSAKTGVDLACSMLDGGAVGEASEIESVQKDKSQAPWGSRSDPSCKSSHATIVQLMEMGFDEPT